jgi:hypothetical protein
MKKSIRITNGSSVNEMEVTTNKTHKFCGEIINIIINSKIDNFNKFSQTSDLNCEPKSPFENKKNHFPKKILRRIKKSKLNFKTKKLELKNLLKQCLNENQSTNIRLVKIQKQLLLCKNKENQVNNSNLTNPQNSNETRDIYVEDISNESVDFNEESYQNALSQSEIDITSDNVKSIPSFLFFKANENSKTKARCRRKDFFKTAVTLHSDNFINLYKFLCKFLLDEHFDDNDIKTLSIMERKILRWFLLKKQLLNKKTMHIPLSVEHLNQIKPNQSRKIDEEKLKYILLNTMNYLKQHWVLEQRHLNHDIKYLKIFESLSLQYKIDISFYLHYFGETAFTNKKSITRYFHPQKSFKDSDKFFNEEELKCKPKTITKTYIDDLKECEKFMKDFKDFVNGNFVYYLDNSKIGFIDVIKSTIKNKLAMKINVWNEMLIQQGQKVIQNDLLNNNKCKLPWFLLNVKDAIRHTKMKFDID